MCSATSMPVLATALCKACKGIKKAKEVAWSTPEEKGQEVEGLACLNEATVRPGTKRAHATAKQQTAAASGRRAVGGVAGWDCLDCPAAASRL